MTNSWRHRRGIAPLASLVLALGAVLAFAGTASAHHHDFGSSDPTGTISSFDPDSGVLTIDLVDGNQISGLVTDDTWISTGSGCRHGSEGSGDDLVPGTVVDDAVLVLADGQATFVKIDLGDSSDSRPTASKAQASRTRR